MDERARHGLIVAALAAAGLWAAAAALRRRGAWDLRGKVVLITGGSRGLGLALARALAARGARLALCARDQDELDRAAADLQPRGADVFTQTCDLATRADIDELVAAVVEHYGRLDALLNNAGVIQVGPMELMTLEDYREAMNVHFWAPLHLTLAALPHLRARGGRILNITSIGGKIAVPHLLPYCASKFALVGFSEGLRAELAKDGIAVTTVVPGLMRTGSPRHAAFKGRHRAEYAWFAISDSLPLLSTDAQRAARRIVAALRYGEAEVILTLPAQIAVRFHGLFPALTAELLALVNRLLPGPGGIGTARATGAQSESRLAPSWLTALTDRAAARHNQLESAPSEAPAP